MRNPPEAFENLIEFIQSNIQNCDLIVFTVSWANLTTKLLRRLMDVLFEKKIEEICDLNLSYNALNLAAKDGGE